MVNGDGLHRPRARLVGPVISRRVADWVGELGLPPLLPLPLPVAWSTDGDVIEKE
jgi:hypothetical protein